MPVAGRIIVFILLGVMLLVLSFLYQKLKDTLFKDDEKETVSEEMTTASPMLNEQEEKENDNE